MVSKDSELKSHKKQQKEENSERFREIKDVLRKNQITRGVTPEKLRMILEELGPTYIKLGQIMSLHSDFLPKAYCDELLKLNSDVTPMPFDDVEDVINHSYGQDWRELFQFIEEAPLGSASIAQVHRARLKNGEEVIIKVERKGIYDTMARDIGLLHRLVKLIPLVGDFKNLVDLDMVLDELWSVAQEEMDFLKEAANMDEFSRNNASVQYVTTPKLYHEYSTGHVLVMEYIDGYSLDDVESLQNAGYDMDEIGTKFVNNFIKQVMDDGFFHADPHPGNVKIRDGKIVWIDMGMMGRLSEKDRHTMIKGIRGIALHDISMVENSVLEIGEFRGKPDRERLYQDLKKFIADYGTTSMGSLDVAATIAGLVEIMKQNRISLPHGVSMLCRGLTHIQGVLAVISPDINMMQIAVNRYTEDFLKNINWKSEFQKQARIVYRSVNKGVEIPGLVTDILKEHLEGQSVVNIDLHSSEDLTNVISAAIRNIVVGLCVAALLIASSVICTTDMTPKILGIPALGFAGYAFAMVVSIFLTVRYLWSKRKKRK
ncbi:MAG: ABC1 kinase family protein [Anaerobutyricum soehngenii]|uniref:ABC1 kinase family protein n=1 Tax=Anaerobutyricum soehngenii TaxID=105843 RepID=UPI003A36B5A3